MTFETKPPAGAKDLLDSAAGWTYVDVRSVAEFDQGHPQGAYNVPLADQGPGGQMVPNPRFVEVMQKTFAADAPLVIGCAAGGRSARACEMLVAAGFQRLVNMHGGFSGARDMTGQITEQGWQACGFPVAQQAPAERTYQGLAG